MSFHYSVSLQVWHPSDTPKYIASSIGLTPNRSWEVGEPRCTPKGLPLTGTYCESYCVFDLGGGDDGRLADFLDDILATLEQAAPFISELRRTGGKVSFFVSWSPGERGEVFRVELLANMARLGIDLGIEPIV